MRSRSLLDSKSLLALSVGDLESWVSGLNQLTTNQPTGNLVPEFESQTLRRKVNKKKELINFGIHL